MDSTLGWREVVLILLFWLYQVRDTNPRSLFHNLLPLCRIKQDLGDVELCLVSGYCVDCSEDVLGLTFARVAKEGYINMRALFRAGKLIEHRGGSWR